MFQNFKTMKAEITLLKQTVSELVAKQTEIQHKHASNIERVLVVMNLVNIKMNDMEKRLRELEAIMNKTY